MGAFISKAALFVPRSSPLSKICAIAGGSGAGKTTLARMVHEVLIEDADHLAIDWYYKDLSHITMEERRAVNYDHPDSLEFGLFGEHLDNLRDGQPVHAPQYDFATHTRTTDVITVKPRPVVVADGILLLAVPEVRPHYDHAVFVDVPEQVRLERRVRRDVAARGRDADDIVRQWNEFVAPMHAELVQPSMAFADRVVTMDEDFTAVARDIAHHLLGNGAR